MIAFRVDANEYIATGHLMRCLAMAVELRRRGEQCIFFLAEEKETERIHMWEFPYEILYSQWNRLEQELPKMKVLLEKFSPDWLVVDSYQVTAEYLEQLDNQVPVMYVDDMAQEVWPVSMVLHYSDWLEDNFYREKYKGSGTWVLAGMTYTPLRDEFYSTEYSKGQKKQDKRWNGEEQHSEGNILITTGGTDTYHVAGRFLEYIFNQGISQNGEKKENLGEYKDKPERKSVDLTALTYHVIVGSMNQYKEELKRLEQKYSNIFLHYNVSNMGEMMRNSDAAISAGGTTLFELCACQVPTICFSFADNQEKFARKMGEKQVMLYAGDPRYKDVDFIGNLAKTLEKLAEDSVLMEKLKKNMSSLVDGNGAKRIAEALCNDVERNAGTLEH